MSWRSYILDHFWLKLFSLALAMLIWFTIHLTIDRDLSPSSLLTREFTARRVFAHVPVQILAGPGEAQAFKLDPTQVALTVRGDRNRVQDLTNRDFLAFVNLTGLQPTRGWVRRVEVQSPRGVTLIEISPDMVRVEPVVVSTNAREANPSNP